MTEAQKQAVLTRDYNAAIAEGGNIYFLAKIFATDGLSFQQAVSTMTDMTVEEYAAMMLAGGRSIEGNRSIKEQTLTWPESLPALTTSHVPAIGAAHRPRQDRDRLLAPAVRGLRVDQTMDQGRSPTSSSSSTTTTRRRSRWR